MFRIQINKNYFRVAAVLVMLVGVFTLSIETACSEPLATVSFIDVGEGDAILIESANESALIDSGNLISAYAVNDYLFKRKIKKLNTLILTHPHPDHIGGSFFISQAFNPDLFADNAENLSRTQQDIYRWYDDLRKSAKNYRALKAGDTIKVGNLQLELIWPSGSGVTKDWNSNSLVISLKVAKFRALLMGDANHQTEKILLDKGIDLKADLLKVGHHGADDSCSKDFIDAVAPEYSVISVNKGNLKGKPDREVLKRLREKSKVLLTSEEGTLVFEIQPNGRYAVVR